MQSVSSASVPMTMTQEAGTTLLALKYHLTHLRIRHHLMLRLVLPHRRLVLQLLQSKMKVDCSVVQLRSPLILFMTVSAVTEMKTEYASVVHEIMFGFLIMKPKGEWLPRKVSVSDVWEMHVDFAFALKFEM